MNLDGALESDLNDLRRRGLGRTLRRTETAPQAHTRVNGRDLLVFGSNDYLGLAAHPAVVEAACAACRAWGAGATGSRLTTGNLTLHEQLEAALAEWYQAEAALLFPSGYQAATSTIPALVTHGDLILSDALNHACLIDGCRQSKAAVRVYRHADATHAAALLADRARFRRVLVVTDGVFSMDGVRAPLPDLVAACEANDAWLMVDDAHGTGVLGPTGAGTAEHFALGDRVHIRMGALSKALGGEGGFIVGSRPLIDWLRHRARGFAFSTGASPANSGAALAAVRLARTGADLRARLHANATRLRELLDDVLPPVGAAPAAAGSPIVPIIFGAAEAASAAALSVESAGVWAPAIRPPTVPEGSARLRLTVTATHSDDDLDRAATAVRAAWEARE